MNRTKIVMFGTLAVKYMDRTNSPGHLSDIQDCATRHHPPTSEARAPNISLHEYAGTLYSHSVTTFRPTADPVSLPPASGLARP